jgi:hypothetical protein
MALSAEKRTERSVDSLQKVYAFVISLALVQAIQIVLVDRATMDFVDLRKLLHISHCRCGCARKGQCLCAAS